MKFIFFVLVFGNAFSQSSDERFQKINKSYLEKVKPIFKRTCFDCHSDQVVYPWYYKIPGIKQLIDHDIKEGLEHLDLSKDYPFKGSKKGLKHDLDEIWESIDENEMPPFIYRIISKERKLSQEDKTIIKSWIDESLKELNQ